MKTVMQHDRSTSREIAFTREEIAVMIDVTRSKSHEDHAVMPGSADAGYQL